MEELMNSMVRFSAALTAFGIKQLQNAITAPSESLKGVEHMREAMDSATRALTNQIADREKTAMNSAVAVGSDLVARTVGAIDGTALDPRRVMETTTDIVQKAAETLTGRRGKKRPAAAHQPATSAAARK